MKYSELVELYERIEGTTKRLEKTYFISEFLRKTEVDDLPQITLLLQGRLYPPWDEREIGVASQMMVKAINLATGVGSGTVGKEWKKTGDLGKVAAEFTHRKKQATLVAHELSVKKVFENLRKLAEVEGSGSVDRKIKLIAELLTSAKPKEALYITRSVLQDLRVGVGAGAMRDAISWAFFPKVVGIFFKCEKCHKWMPAAPKCLECKHNLSKKFKDTIKDFKAKNILEIESIDDLKHPEKYDFILTKDEKIARQAYNRLLDSVQEAYDLTNDFGIVAKTVKQHGLSGLGAIELEVGVPLKVMLAPKVDTLDEGFETTGRPAQFEYKYDGFRMQVHKKGKKVWIYTRRLDDVAKQFPDVVETVQNHVAAEKFILDCEAVGYSPKTKKYTSFQHISQRIKRKYEIEKMVYELPVELNVFDIICLDGKNLLQKPFKERRALIKKIIKPVKRKIVVSKGIVTGEEKEANDFFKESIKDGNEGLMIKNLEAPYKPGARIGYMLKYKQLTEYLDLVIVGAEWGEGKRARWLSSFTVACKHGDHFEEIGKVGTGIKEKLEQGLSFEQLTTLLKPLVTKEMGKTVKIKPEVVVEIGYSEIQKSPTYASGFALRFPRVIRLREDKGIDEATTLTIVKHYYEKQKK